MFSLYVHVPFCTARGLSTSKCGYCSFYSEPFDLVSGAGASRGEAWLSALSAEVERLRASLGGRVPLRTVYIGGGTPSVLPLPMWRRLLDVLESIASAPPTEATVEANPCSLTGGHLRMWRDSFITRVSLGVQSASDAELRTLGRAHDVSAARRAIDMVLASGLDLSIDLIFGIPGQTLASWKNSLSLAAAGANHVSTYQLTLEPDTPMARAMQTGELLPDGYLFYRFAQWYLPRKGIKQYEISSFAREGHECRHNLAYWRQEDVLALGPSAWGYISGTDSSGSADPSGGDFGFRYANAPTLSEYIALLGERAFPVVYTERTSGRERALEAAILSLRTSGGIDGAAFAKKFGMEAAQAVMSVLDGMPERLTVRRGTSIALTSTGMRVGNSIWSELLELLPA
ncbi:MAG: radical SAM family heme chaperone HemW [Synergistaceae bacterium]|nr:radical SAM family heme chaperone HemW [Synergistaceae bacterium]